MKKMKKLVGLLVFLAAFCFGIVATPETAKADVLLDFNLNNTYELKYEDRIHDFEGVELANSGRMTFKFIADDSSAKSTIAIYDETDTRIFWKDEIRGSYNISVDLKAGTYTFRFYNSNYGSFRGPADGLLAFSFKDAKETYKENALDTNDQAGAASYIKSVKNKKVNGQFAANDTVDFYKFKLTKPQKLSLTFKSTLSDVQLHLYNSSLDYELRYNLSTGTNKYTEVLPKGTYYVSFENDEDATTGNYTLQLKTSDLKKASLKTLKSTAKKQAKATWKKASGVDGYQIQIATNSKFTKGKKSYTTTKTSYTMKKLTSQKTYYVRIRTYTIAENGKKCYSDWSKVEKIKVK